MCPQAVDLQGDALAIAIADVDARAVHAARGTFPELPPRETEDATRPELPQALKCRQRAAQRDVGYADDADVDDQTSEVEAQGQRRRVVIRDERDSAAKEVEFRTFGFVAANVAPHELRQGR